MGNTGCQECADGKEEIFSKTLGHIIYDPNIQIGNPETPTFYEIEEAKNLKNIKKISQKWSKINSLKTSLIIKPLKIDKYTEKGSFFFKTYQLKVYFNAYSFSLSKFCEENLKINPILPEIHILNIISCVINALNWCKTYNLPHLNISPDTIFLDNSGLWVITPPNNEKISLMERRDQEELVSFLISPELQNEADLGKLDWVGNDVFSLGISVLHCIYPFHRFYLNKALKKDEIDKKMNFFRSYYSEDLIFLLGHMVELDFTKRKGLEFLIKLLKAIQNNNFNKKSLI